MDGNRPASESDALRVVVIGAGIAGLATTLRLSALGFRVTLLERHNHVGGKIRALPSDAGPVAAGPTVLTMRHVFDALFKAAGTQIEDHVQLVPQDLIARHFWPDGSRLDLLHDADQTLSAIEAFSGRKSADEYLRFSDRARELWNAFDAPMMREPEPNIGALTRHVLRQPSLIHTMAPLSSLSSLLTGAFSDPRLRQLFGRYATYVGGSPTHAPAILALIWHAEAQGVWTIPDGIQSLAHAIADLAMTQGADIQLGAHVDHIQTHKGAASGVALSEGRTIPADIVCFAGDPRALAVGALGGAVRAAVRLDAAKPRSFSARVHSFAATPSGLDLAHHNILFDADPRSEFVDLMAGRIPQNPSIYVCAMDRGTDTPPPAMERFEMITNAPAVDTLEDSGDLDQWHATIMHRMEQRNLSFHPKPSPQAVTTEQMFAQLFPESLGALYGQSPHGLTSSLNRPTARTRLPGLYLAGGGCHPGAGVPMATLSAQHAVEAILKDRISGSMLAQMVTHGGMSTA